MTDYNRPFLQHHLVMSNAKDPSTFERAMLFANPTLLGLLLMRKLDLYIDATFDCRPSPFYQYLIISPMVQDQTTDAYVPITNHVCFDDTQEPGIVLAGIDAGCGTFEMETQCQFFHD